MSESECHTVMPDSLRPLGLEPSSLLRPWDFPGKNTGVGCHFLLQGIFPTQGLNTGLLHWRQILYHLSHQGSPVSARCPSLITAAQICPQTVRFSQEVTELNYSSVILAVFHYYFQFWYIFSLLLSHLIQVLSWMTYFGKLQEIFTRSLHWVSRDIVESRMSYCLTWFHDALGVINY